MGKGISPVKGSNKSGKTSGSGTAKRPAMANKSAVKAVKGSRPMGKGHA